MQPRAQGLKDLEPAFSQQLPPASAAQVHQLDRCRPCAEAGSRSRGGLAQFSSTALTTAPNSRTAAERKKYSSRTMMAPMLPYMAS